MVFAKAAGLMRRTAGAIVSWANPTQRAQSLLVQAGFKLIGKADFTEIKQMKREIEGALNYDPLYAAHAVIDLVATYFRAISEGKWMPNIDWYHQRLNWFESEIIGVYFYGNREAFKYFLGLREVRIDYGDPKQPTEIIQFDKPDDYDEIVSQLTLRHKFTIHSFTNDLREDIRFFLSLTRTEDVLPQPLIIQQPMFNQTQPVPIARPPYGTTGEGQQ